MANINRDLEKAQARKLYLAGVTSPVQLAAIVGVPRQTIRTWIERDNWTHLAATNNVSTLDIVQQVTQMLDLLLKEAREMKDNGEQPSMLTTKNILFYTRALRQLDEDYDVRGSLVHWSNKYINFVSAVPNDVIADKKAFVAALQKTLPLFLKSQDNA